MIIIIMMDRGWNLDSIGEMNNKLKEKERETKKKRK